VGLDSAQVIVFEAVVGSSPIQRAVQGRSLIGEVA